MNLIKFSEVPVPTQITMQVQPEAVENGDIPSCGALWHWLTEINFFLLQSCIREGSLAPASFTWTLDK